MCGITGLYSSRPITGDQLLQFRTCISNLNHRGPDVGGEYRGERILIGHRRLSIIDLSDAGNQPMTDQSGKYVISYNGECYNYRELRKSLMGSGYQFRSECDTEVVLNLLIAKGHGGLNEINGFFSLALYNTETGELLLARDRYGIKPLYYSIRGDDIYFASELNGITPYFNSLSLNKISLMSYLHLNYIPAPYSIFNEVLKLRPGYFLAIGSGGNIETKPYYELANVPENRKKVDKHAIVSALETSVARRLVSDVPLGCFLSGGMDSSAIVALVSRHTDKPRTFTVSFKEGNQYDEGPDALEVSRHFHTEHTEIEMNESDLLGDVADMLNRMDEPFGDSSAIAMHRLCKSVSPHIKVALSGDGGDELFAGYLKHRALYHSFHSTWINRLISPLAPFLAKLPKSRKKGSLNLFRKMSRYASAVNEEPWRRYWDWAGFGNPVEEDLFSDEHSPKQWLEHMSGIGIRSFQDCLLVDMKMVLEGDMLVKSDRMSMQAGMEVRLPFLDHEFVELVRSLNAEDHIRRGKGKALLKEAFADILPERILEKKKHGFEVPLAAWLKSDLNYMADELLSDDLIGGQNLFDLQAVHSLKSMLHRTNSSNSEYAIWNLLVFNRWWLNNRDKLIIR